MSSANDLVFSVAMVDLDFALEQMLSLFDVQEQERRVPWMHEICAYSRLIHLNTWADRPPVEFVRAKVLDAVLKRAAREVTEQIEKRCFSEAELEIARHFRENVILRIRNLEENYLSGKPSDFDPGEPEPSTPGNLTAS